MSGFVKRPFERGLRKHKLNNILKDRVGRHIKRSMIQSGLILDPDDRPKFYRFNWVYGELSGVIYSDQKSQARAVLKRQLGLPTSKRLPMGISMTREHNPKYQQALEKVYARLQSSNQ